MGCFKQIRATLLAMQVKAIEDRVDLVEQFKISTLRKLDGLTCAAHGKRPAVDFHGSTLRDIRITMRCCCGQLSAQANRAIAAG